MWYLKKSVKETINRQHYLVTWKASQTSLLPGWVGQLHDFRLGEKKEDQFVMKRTHHHENHAKATP